MERTSGLTQGSTMELLFLLYDTHRSMSGANADSLDHFLEWAPTTLRDISEVDAHLLDLKALYKDLRAYHELDEWSFSLGELSPVQQRANAEWRATGDLHNAFHERMWQGRIATSGYITRICAERTQENIALPWDFIWFAGLNALDPGTTATIKQLKQQGRAEVAWDADAFYLDDARQEGGRFLRRSIADLGAGALPARNGILGTERRIRLVEAPHALAQTAYVAQRLNELSAEERARTAVVLAQEDLLLPLLERMPADMGPVNVTMGMPLAALPVHGLAESYLDLLADASEGTFTVRGLLAVFSHPFVQEGKATPAILTGLRGQARLHIERQALTDLIVASGTRHAEAIMHALDAAGDPARIGAGFTGLFDWASHCAPNDPVVREQLFLMARVQQRMDRLLQRAGITQPDLRAYRAIRERVLREERLAFIGEPLHGLQVMGLLETRTVDHERIIFIGVNEGTLPRTDAPASWIPYELRRHHGLPLPSDAEAVTAYNFQRAMQLAHDVEWTLSTGDGREPGEPSRFIAQWQHEVIGHSRTELSILRVGQAANVRGLRPIRVEKDEHVLQRLRALCERGLSPSAIGTWLRCPLDFYFRYVAGVRDREVVDGRLGSDVLGDAVHNTLQQLLTPFIGRDLRPEDLAEARTHVTRVLSDKLAEHLPRTALEHGHYRLRREMAAKALENYMDAEAVRCATSHTQLVAVELDVKAMLSNGTLLKGRCDRIDLRDGRMTVLDVKTGKVNDYDLRLPDLERESMRPDRRYALQLLIYLWAYLREHPEVEQASAGVIPLQRATQAAGEFLRIGNEEVIHQRQLPEIEALLVRLVNEMLDPDVPFMHDPKSGYCACCV